MKVLVFSLALLLILACGEALVCNRCSFSGGGRGCTTTVETCRNGFDACITAHFLFYPYSYFKRCIKMADCRLLQSNRYISAYCCDTDRCN